MADVEIRLSGTIEVQSDGEQVAVPGMRVRALLVMLALSAGRTVPIDTLARGIWGDDPPANVRGSLQTYVGRLRRVLGSDLVVTGPAGYLLDLPRDSVDLLRFERLVTGSRDAADSHTERAVLDEALALWSGDPFGRAPSERIEQQVVPELTERQLQAVERRVDLDLRDGDASGHLPQLRTLLERHPLRETLWVRLLTALDRAGRSAEALERYDALRTRLADDLGVDPSPELQQLHLALLSADVPRAETEPSARPTAPRQLPPAVVGFTGRSEQLAALDSAVAEADPPLVALHGPGGVGKTALAIHWASRKGDRFPDGQLFVDLRGYGPGEPVDPLDALDTLLRGLGLPGSDIPADTEGRSALLRTELSGRRPLVVLDNAREAAQVRPLLAGGSTTTVVTSRSQLRGLVSREGARRVAVGPMPPDDAVALLAGRFGIATTDQAAQLTDLADLCGRLPVALTVAAERAGRDGRHRIAEVNDRLRDEHDRLAALTDWADDPLTDVRAVFSWSYQALDADTARMFRLLGRHPHSRIATEAASALAGVDGHTTERLLDRLTDRHLLREISLGWYELHDLAHAYADELAAAEPDESAAAVRRLRNWYLHSVRNAMGTRATSWIVYTVPDAAPQTSPAQFDSPERATDWLLTHRRCIRSMLVDAARTGANDVVPRLMPSLSRFLKQIGATREAIELLTLAANCARLEDDRILEAVCRHQLGHFLSHLGDVDATLSAYEAARDLFADLDHTDGVLGSEIAIGATYATLGRFDEAIETLTRATREGRGANSRVLATGLNNLATSYLEFGRVQDANDAAVRAVATAAGDEDTLKDDLAAFYITLGEAQSADSRWNTAVETLGEAVRLCTAYGNLALKIVTLQLRGTAFRELGDLGAARSDWTTALELLDELGQESVPVVLTSASGRRDDLRQFLDDLEDSAASDARR